jgi:hypothetical protein
VTIWGIDITYGCSSKRQAATTCHIVSRETL